VGYQEGRCRSSDKIYIRGRCDRPTWSHPAEAPLVILPTGRSILLVTCELGEGTCYLKKLHPETFVQVLIRALILSLLPFKECGCSITVNLSSSCRMTSRYPSALACSRVIARSSDSISSDFVCSRSSASLFVDVGGSGPAWDDVSAVARK
jgi:hypothetical protein